MCPPGSDATAGEIARDAAQDAGSQRVGEDAAILKNLMRRAVGGGG
jgi:hypothetical protein